MPKEDFYDWNTGERKVLEVRWAGPTDVSPGIVCIHSASEGFEQIANTGDITGLNRLIRSLKRARRALLSESTTADLAVDSYLKE